MEERIEKVEEQLDKLEADFYGMMKKFGIKGELDIKYSEYYETKNPILLVSCVGNLDGDDFCWSTEWHPTTQTGNSFMYEIVTKLFDELMKHKNN